MNVQEFKGLLAAHPDKPLVFVLPDGGYIEPHFHVTEVGHVRKNFVDCGGTRRSNDACVLQAWVADDEEHRLSSEKLAGIFARAGDVLPHEELPVEVEYEDCLLSQFPVVSAEPTETALFFHLGVKHTDCLAKELCLPDGCCSNGDSGCCS